MIKLLTLGTLITIATTSCSPEQVEQMTDLSERLVVAEETQAEVAQENTVKDQEIERLTLEVSRLNRELRDCRYESTPTPILPETISNVDEWTPPQLRMDGEDLYGAKYRLNNTKEVYYRKWRSAENRSYHVRLEEPAIVEQADKELAIALERLGIVRGLLSSAERAYEEEQRERSGI